MTSEINPLRSNNSPMPNAGNAGPEGLRNQYNQRGNRGGKDKDEKKKEEKDEPEASAEEADEEQGHLDTDSFSGRKARSVIDNLFSESLPWEREEEDRIAKLEELKRKREELTRRGGTSPGSAARPATGPLGRKPGGTGPQLPARGGTGPLGNVKVPPPPVDAPPPAAAPGGTPIGRRVDENFDPTAALNSTLLAQQALRDRQAQRERDEKERLDREAQALDAPGLAKFLRPAAGPRTPSERVATPMDDGGMLTAPTRPDIEIAPVSEARSAAVEAARRAVAPPAVRPPSVDDLAGSAPPSGPATPTPRTPTGKLPSRLPAPPRPGSGKLDATLAAGQARQAPRSPADQGGQVRPPADPGRQPRARTGPLPMAEPAARADLAEARGPAAPSWTTAGSDPIPPLDALASVVPAAEADVAPFPSDDVAADTAAGAGGPAVFGDGTPPPPVKAGKVSAACVYRIIDVGTNKPLGGARVELEPTSDDLLPNIHGQANQHGWYAAEGLPPGEYRVTVRAPGYIPAFKVRLLDLGVVDDLAIFIGKP